MNKLDIYSQAKIIEINWMYSMEGGWREVVTELV